jgi:hypothetical protein
MLEELKLVTSLISKLAPFGKLGKDNSTKKFLTKFSLVEDLNFDMLPSNLSVEFQANLTRIQKELINLICIYFVPEQLKSLRKDIEIRIAPDDSAAQKSMRLCCVQIAANVCSFCTSMMKGSGIKMSQLVFSPKLIENVVTRKLILKILSLKNVKYFALNRCSIVDS